MSRRSAGERPVRPLAPALLALLACAALPAIAGAHPPPKAPPADLIRLQGFRAAGPAGTDARKLILTVDGRPQDFYATELHHFSLLDPSVTEEPDTTRPFFLQANPDVLTRFSAARPDQRITILAQWRPGRSDLFVLSIDLCPEH